MARTLDPAAHAVRRDTFIESAQRLIQAKGYEQMSVQDVLDDVGASRGAFYHYFDSKAALLDGVVGRMVEQATAAMGSILADPKRSAIESLNDFFRGLASWKGERKEFLLRLMEVWLSDDNAIVREQFRRRVVATMTPLLADIIRQGVREESFDVTSPEHTARVLVGLLAGANEHAGHLYLSLQATHVPFEVVEGALRAYPEALERILGARQGSLWWVDDSTLHEWFG